MRVGGKRSCSHEVLLDAGEDVASKRARCTTAEKGAIRSNTDRLGRSIPATVSKRIRPRRMFVAVA